MFGDNPSGWALGRMRRFYMGRANPFGGLVSGLTGDEFLQPRKAVGERRCRKPLPVWVSFIRLMRHNVPVECVAEL